MRNAFFGFILLAGQLIPMQARPVVHLQPHRNAIEARFDGSLIELVNAPAIVYLPAFPPKADPNGMPWSVDVKDLGPGRVTVTDGKGRFQRDVQVGQTLHIYSNGTVYLLRH